MSEKDKKQAEEPEIPENPGFLPYAHHVGSALINPLDKGKIKGRAMTAMAQQTEKQFEQIREQIDLLATQAKRLQRRVELSEQIYLAEMSFEPIHNTIYHLYEKSDGSYALSMIGPNEWGTQGGFERHLASVQLLADHTWDILDDQGLNLDSEE